MEYKIESRTIMPLYSMTSQENHDVSRDGGKNKKRVRHDDAMIIEVDEDRSSTPDSWRKHLRLTKKEVTFATQAPRCIIPQVAGSN